ncbi:MAG: hypothetical protein JWQ03_505 [Variovorax sp.]|nr:hypothetical protein [Variovorax sp.]
MTDTELQVMAAVASAIAAGGSLVVAVFAASLAHKATEVARTNLLISVNAQKGSTLSRCMEVYSKIEEDLIAGNLSGSRYFERVWGLHYAQYHLFVLGQIPEHVYIGWLMARHRAYQHGSPQGTPPMSQADGWAHAREIIEDADFTAFIEGFLLDAQATKGTVSGHAHATASRAQPLQV